MSETPVVEATPLRVLLIGATGMLGSDVAAEARRRGWNLVAPTSQELNLTEPRHLEQLRVHDWGNLDWVINCAAYTAVDKAESEFWAAQQLNGTAPGILAMICARNKWRFLHVSSDFVFRGDASQPYRETDETGPISKYGQSKLFGEQNALKENPDSLIVRTSWLFGPNGKSFPRTLINAWKEGRDLRVVADQTGTPTYTGDLARVIGDLVSLSPGGGIFHAAGPDVMTWHDFATGAISAWKNAYGPHEREVLVSPIKTEEWPTPATRPRCSALSSEKIQSLGIAPMRPMSEAWADFVQRLGPEG